MLCFIVPLDMIPSAEEEDVYEDLANGNFSNPLSSKRLSQKFISIR